MQGNRYRVRETMKAGSGLLHKNGLKYVTAMETVGVKVVNILRRFLMKKVVSSSSKTTLCRPSLCFQPWFNNKL